MLKILVYLLFFVSSIQANFDFKLGYCRVKCKNSCEVTKDPAEESEKIDAYYWRDFYGKIPKDALPMGNSNQYPQTYVGMVYVPEKNGTFVTTIVDGLDYVYVVQDGEVFNKSDNIQILCTMEPDRMIWVRLTQDNFKTYAGYDMVRASQHVVFEAVNSRRVYLHYVTKTPTCGVFYAGFFCSLEDTVMEYAFLDGTPANETNVLWLMYKTKKFNDGEENMAQSFFSHRYEYKIRPDSIIPSFFKQINVGNCSLTCTNQDEDNKALESMAYYWKPNNVFKKEEVMTIGYNYAGEAQYIAQTYCNTFNWYIVGDVEAKSPTTTYVAFENSGTAETTYFQFFSTKYPDKFEWINTTTETFSQLDQSRLIPGGQMDNGTKIFLGRKVDRYTIAPGDVRVLDTGAFCHTIHGPYDDFQVLMFKNPDQKKNT